MSADLKPPDSDNVQDSSSGEADQLRRFARSPHPYLIHGLEINQGDDDVAHERAAGAGTVVSDQGRNPENEHWHGRSGQASVTGSESGTEADDERPSFVRALPAPYLRPRKGLKGGEKSEDALLTPSQLDDDGRRLSLECFRRKPQEKERSKEELKVEQEKLQRRRLNEFARRTSEVALVGVVVACVLCGRGVWQTARQWWRELLSHVLTITMLILAYPVKLSIVDTQASYSKPWQRFRVPASFDPATVLYPPLLPVLVALSVSPANPAVILPNIILGLASLPQRLFPRSSRLVGINAVHWLISIIPVIAAENTSWPSKTRPPAPYMLKGGSPQGLPSEMIVLLYPLHHALLQPLHYLTTTSLLVSELHLLSAALINLLFFASAPQAVILKACLWVGGLLLFVFCDRVLHWNVTLMRVPKWKLRRPGHSAAERKSLIDSITELIKLQRAKSAFRSRSEPPDSDADEPETAIKELPNGKPKLATSGFDLSVFGRDVSIEAKSAVEPRQVDFDGAESGFNAHSKRTRRNTLPGGEQPRIESQRSTGRKKSKPSNLLWCLQLTPAQAERRKWMYAGYVFAVIVAVILGPVRDYISQKALSNQEPVGWAMSYLFGQLNIFRTMAGGLRLEQWTPLPKESANLYYIRLSLLLDVRAIRCVIGPANVRLLLIAYWAFVLLVGLLTVFSLTAYVEVDTRRKVFHGVMVAMLVPATFIDPCYCALTLSLILAVFLVLEVIRAGQVPPLGNAIGRFVAPYVDGRDLRGPVVISHIFLLIGCAVPLWFSLAGMRREGGPPWKDWELKDGQREVGMVAGVICVGMGDAAASLIGRRYGRHKWLWVGGKSLEGSAAFAAAVTIGLMAAKVWLEVGGWQDSAQQPISQAEDSRVQRLALTWLLAMAKAMFCACGASFMEAVLTGANDNVVVPVALWLLVKGVQL